MTCFTLIRIQSVWVNHYLINARKLAGSWWRQVVGNNIKMLSNNITQVSSLQRNPACPRCNGFYIAKGTVFRMIDAICIGIKTKVKTADTITACDHGHIECMSWQEMMDCVLRWYYHTYVLCCNTSVASPISLERVTAQNHPWMSISRFSVFHAAL